jgi:hypothetical protein
MNDGVMSFAGPFSSRDCGYFIAFATALTGCSDAGGKDLKHQIQWHQDGNSEIQDCHTFKLDNDKPSEIDRITVNFPPGSHHVHTYRSDTPVDDSVYDCFSGIDWDVWHLVLGVQTQPMDWQLDPGLTVPMDAHQQLLVQVHWLNSTPDPVDREIDMTFHEVEHSEAHVGVLFGVNKQTAMAPHEHKTLRQWCPMAPDKKLVAMMGHYHGLGTHYAVWAQGERDESGDKIYDALDQQTFEFQLFNPPYEMPANDGLMFECDFYNSRDIPITWGSDTKTQEHCNLSAYFYPAESVTDFCLIGPTEISQITGPATRPHPGVLATYTIQLDVPAPTGGSPIELTSSDPSILQVPATIVAPAGIQTVTFQAMPLRPGHVQLSAKLGAVTKSVTTAVGGLVLSEIHVGMSGQANNKQWVELANTSEMPIDLSHFSLGAGATDYMTTRQQLHITVPAKGCVVVGGPELTAPGQPAYDEAFDFDPSLGFGSGSGANGIALFDVTADKIDATVVPLDTLVYGKDNNSLIDTTGNLASVVTPVSGDGTYYRPNETEWDTQLVQTPKICEVH